MIDRTELKEGDILYLVQCGDDIENPRSDDFYINKCEVLDQPHQYLRTPTYPLIMVKIHSNLCSYNTYIAFRNCYKTPKEAGDYIVGKIREDMTDLLSAITRIDSQVEHLSKV